MKDSKQSCDEKYEHLSFCRGKHAGKAHAPGNAGLFVFRSMYGILTAFILITGCTGRKAGPQPSVPVTVDRVVVQPEPLSLIAVGYVEPIETVSIKAQVGGLLTEVRFSEGQDVQTGQLLFQIDPRPLQASLDAATAQLAKDKSQAENAERESKRTTDLVKKDYVAQEQYEAAKTQADVFESLVKVDEAAVEQARLNLDYASIRAPISGRTGSLLLKKGNVVRANDLPLVVINQMRPIRVNFAIPENQLPLVQKYASRNKLEVHVKTSRTQNGSEAKGRLCFIDNTVDPGTGTVALKAEFPNLDGSLWPGQFVDTELILTIEIRALTVPAGAIVTGQDGTFIFTVGPDKKVEKRPVKVNRTLNNLAVIDEGLKVGETVVTDGQMRLVPGAVVEIKSNSPKPGKNP
jgi:multidrug efflux system membrane fusion protein